MFVARLAHLRYGLPGEPVDDAVLAQELDCDRADVEKHSRCRLRFIAPDGEGPADLAAVVAREVLDSAGLATDDLDLISFSTNSPDLFFPGSACLLQKHLDAATVGCLDLRSQCTGFLTALDVARRFIEAGGARRILLASGDFPSRQNRLDGGTLELTSAMSDGVAVALVERGEGAGQVLSCLLASDGARHKDYWCEFPSSRHLTTTGIARGQRITHEAFEQGRHFPVADLAAMQATALAGLPGIFAEALEASGLESVDATLVAHLDPGTETAVAGRLGDCAGRGLASDLLYTGGTSLPLGLARAKERGEVEAGQNLAVLTAGAGAGWGAAIVRVPE